MNSIYSMHTDIGTVKTTNQDSMCVKEARTQKGQILFAIVCDGMGGLEKGEVASATVIKAFSDWFERELPYQLAKQNYLDEIECQWDAMLKEQNQNIMNYGAANHIQLGTTFTALLMLENGKYLIGHVGDTRVYQLLDNQVNVLTEDQTVVQKEIREGRLTPEQAEVDPRRNVLLQCIGASNVVEPAFYHGRATQGECYMLCSDGFRHENSVQEIWDGLSPLVNSYEEEMHMHLVSLVELCKSRGETDNISAILIKTM